MKYIVFKCPRRLARAHKQHISKTYQVHCIRIKEKEQTKTAGKTRCLWEVISEVKTQSLYVIVPNEISKINKPQKDLYLPRKQSLYTLF